MKIMSSSVVKFGHGIHHLMNSLALAALQIGWSVLGKVKNKAGNEYKKLNIGK